MISRSMNVEADPGSYKSKFSRKPEGKDYLNQILPFSSGCVNSIGEDRRRERELKFKLSEEELSDYRVPLNVFLSHVKVLKGTRPALKLSMLRALNIDDNQNNPKVGWEEFLRMNQIF